MRASVLGTPGHGRVRMLVIMAALTASLASCAGPPPAYQYFEPSSAPAARQQYLVNGSPYRVQSAIVAELRTSPFEVTRIDPRGRFVIAEYSGDPQPFLDCGLLLTIPQQQPVKTDAVPAVVTGRTLQTRAGTFDRRLRLDARLATEIEPRGRQSLVSTNATYVLSKLLYDEDGQEAGREVVAFSSGERAVFRKGMVCQPTGAFERTAAAAVYGGNFAARSETLPAEPLTPAAERAPEPAPGPATPAPSAPVVAALGDPSGPVETAADGETSELEQAIRDAVFPGSCAEVEPVFVDDDTVRVSGVASDLFTMDAVMNAIDLSHPELEVDNQIEILSKPACEAYGLALRQNRLREHAARIEVVDLQDGVINDGAPLRIAVNPPAGHPSIMFAHFRNDGTVDHFRVDLPADGGANGGWLVNAPDELRPPYGRELILAVATQQPLFSSDPPKDAEAFVPELREALARLPAGMDAPAACAVIATEDRGAGGLSVAPGLDIC